VAAVAAEAVEGAVPDVVMSGRARAVDAQLPEQLVGFTSRHAMLTPARTQP
jgi:CelD/BcsL family acetyltransferase involved in cellulose biosynthesis